jgi:hypothetical protein
VPLFHFVDEHHRLGALAQASVSTPPSPYPTYPGGDPTSRLTVCFSWNSLIFMASKI